MGSNTVAYLQIAIRFFLALVFVTYSAAKFFGAQFITEGPVLDTPISQLSGIEATWSYFGRSSLYSNFIALAQLTGGVLLLHQRTVRLALLIMMPMIGNIVLVNFSYGISFETKVFSLILMALLLLLIGMEYRDWFSFLFERPKLPSSKAGLSWRWRVPLVLMFLVVVFVFVGLVTERVLPSCEIAGNWSVVESQGIEAADSFAKLYLMDGGRMGLEKDRAVFFGQQQTDGASKLDFQITVWPTPEELIWQDRLLPDSNPEDLTYRARQQKAQRELHFDGSYQRTAGDRLRLDGVLNQQQVTIFLIKD